MRRATSEAQGGVMNINHDMARALVRAHQRDLEREAASRRFARRQRRDRRLS
jgi:hypothetical protein